MLPIPMTGWFLLVQTRSVWAHGFLWIGPGHPPDSSVWLPGRSVAARRGRWFAVQPSCLRRWHDVVNHGKPNAINVTIHSQATFICGMGYTLGWFRMVHGTMALGFYRVYLRLKHVKPQVATKSSLVLILDLETVESFQNSWLIPGWFLALLPGMCFALEPGIWCRRQGGFLLRHSRDFMGSEMETVRFLLELQRCCHLVK